MAIAGAGRPGAHRARPRGRPQRRRRGRPQLVQDADGVCPVPRPGCAATTSAAPSGPTRRSSSAPASGSMAPSSASATAPTASPGAPTPPSGVPTKDWARRLGTLRRSATRQLGCRRAPPRPRRRRSWSCARSQGCSPPSSVTSRPARRTGADARPGGDARARLDDHPAAPTATVAALSRRRRRRRRHRHTVRRRAPAQHRHGPNEERSR